MTFSVYKDFESTNNAGAGGFQIISLSDNDGNDVTNQIDNGIIFHDDNELKEYLASIFKDEDIDIITED